MSRRKIILAAIENGNEKEIRDFILENRIDVNAVDRSEGNTLLHHAVKFGNESSIKALLDLQANPNIKNQDGKTPLELAKSIGGEIAESMAFQLDEHLRNEMVRREFDARNSEFVRNLVAGGANSMTKDLEGKTAIDLAERSLKRKALLQQTLEEKSLDRLTKQTGAFEEPPVSISGISEGIIKLKTSANKLKETLSRPSKVSSSFSIRRKNSQQQSLLH